MIEKYATGLDNIAATAEQIKTIKKLAEYNGEEYVCPTSYKEAEMMIDSLVVKGNGK